MTPKNYVMYQFEKLSRTSDKKPTKEEFYKIVKEEHVVRFFGSYEKMEEESNYYKAGKKYLADKLLNLYKELKAVPTQEEFTKLEHRYYIRKYFYSYNDLLTYVGLEPNKKGVGRKKCEK